EGENGYLIQLRDVAGLRQAISTSLSRNWDRAQIARSGSRRDWFAVAKEVEEVLTLAVAVTDKTFHPLSANV
ncbi:MAG TPA: hypothetical protein VEF04_10885, partial [Blastocatellia bacterium]|nr:hypothetical protein [Blastocatellia bacterium]